MGATMKTKIGIFSIIFCLWAQALWAVEQRGPLILFKEPLVEFANPRQLPCNGLYDVRMGKNVANMSDFREFLCQGRYTFTLTGEKGRTVTLFAEFNYGKARGFLVVQKTDDRMVWFKDLESLPAGKWVEWEASEDSGGVRFYYYRQAMFPQWISSVKWGQWWQGKVPQ